jgi:MoaA/NifB/PqqE/SkfB family radical SAM enzyme
MNLKLPIGHVCNLRCSRCSIWKIQRNCSIDINEKKKYIDWFSKLYPNEFVSFHGGEPLINKNEVLELIETSSNADLNVILETNGTLFTEDIVNQFVNSGLKILNLSFDSHIKIDCNKYRGKDVYDIILNTIKLFKKFKHIDINLVMILDNYTIDYAIEYFDFCDNLQCKPIINPIEPDFALHTNIKNFRYSEFCIKKDKLDKLDVIGFEYVRRYGENIKRIDNIKKYFHNLNCGITKFDSCCMPTNIIVNDDGTLSKCFHFENISNYKGINIGSFEEFNNFCKNEEYNKKIGICDKYCSISCYNNYVFYK